jgi:hypothetical protein
MMFTVRLGYESLLMSWPRHFDTSDQLHQLHTVRIHKGCSSCNHCLCLCLKFPLFLLCLLLLTLPQPVAVPALPYSR